MSNHAKPFVDLLNSLGIDTSNCTGAVITLKRDGPAVVRLDRIVTSRAEGLSFPVLTEEYTVTKKDLAAPADE